MIGSSNSSKSKSYGFKASVTAVHNDGKYDLNFQFDDVNGTKLDKNLSGKVDELEQDISLALLELYLDIMKKDKAHNAVESSSTRSVPATEEHRTSKPVFEPDTKENISARQDSLDDIFGKIMSDFAKEMQDKQNRDNKRNASNRDTSRRVRPVFRDRSGLDWWSWI